MDIPTIGIDSGRAKRELAHFRSLRDEQRQSEDDAFIRAYRMAAKGLSLIDLGAVMAYAGCEGELPKLAIARADAPMVYYRNWGSSPHFTTASERRHGGSVAPDWDRRGHHHHQRLRHVEWPRTNDYKGFQSAVPIIPPEFRPRWKLSNYHILWEVEQWDVAPPPADPLLLRHCGGSLFAVLAAWDLTELETAILQRRFAQ